MKSKHYLIELGIIFFLSFTCLLWFKPGCLITGTDVDFPLFPKERLQERVFTWYPKILAGVDRSNNTASLPTVVPQAFLSSLGFDRIAVEKITYVFWFFLSGLGIYYLAFLLFKCQSRWGAVARVGAVVVYLFNFYQVFLWVRLQLATSALVLFPVFLALLLGVDRREVSFTRAFLILVPVSIISGSIGIQPPQIFALFLMLSLYCIYSTFLRLREGFSKDVFRSWLVLFMLSLVFLLSSAFWALPLLSFITQAGYWGGSFGAKVYSVHSLLEWVSSITSFLNVFRFFGDVPWFDSWGEEPYFPEFEAYLTNPFLIVLSFAWPLLVFLAPLLARKKREKRVVLFFSLLALLGLFFSRGTHPPFGGAYSWMVDNVPLFWIQRAPWQKFGLLSLVAYSALSGFSLSRLCEKLWRRSEKFKSAPYICVGIVIAFFLSYNYLFVLGKMFPSQKGERGYHQKFDLGFQQRFPNYLFRAREWVNSQKELFKILLLPEDKTNVYDWSYAGSTHITSHLFDKGTLSPQYGEGFAPPGSVEDLYRSVVDEIYVNHGEASNRVLGLMGIKYILQRNDFLYDFYGDVDSPEFIRKRLAFRKDLEFAESFGAWDFYGVSKDNYIPLFYVPTEFSWVGGTTSDLVDVLSFGTWNPREAFYFSGAENGREEDAADRGGLTGFGGYKDIFVKGRKQDAGGGIEGLEWRKGWAWPEANVKPGSWKYPLVQLKERWVEWRAREPLERVDVLLWHGVKRIEEIGKWGAGETTDIKYWILDVGILGYKEKIGKVVEILESVPKEERGEEFWGMVGKALAYMGRTEEKIGDIEELHSGFREWVEGIADIWGEGEYRYEIKIPKDGEYEIYVNKAGWVSFGKRHFAKGKYVLKFEVPLVEGVVLFESLPSVAEPREIPKITFVKVNPTKYRVKVEGAKDPYTLIFSESFHGGWRIYEVQSSKFKVQNDYGDVVASYFDGDIKEGTHRNTFLEPATFETWGKRPLDVEHLEVNGYANSWYIKPEDMGGEEDYELIIEFFPQRLFYIGLLISSLTFLGCVGCLGYAGVKRLE